MNDYIRALRQMFMDTSLYSEEREEIETRRQALVNQLDAPQRDLLMDLVDGESLLREHMAVENFIGGFRLAYNVVRELSERPPYTFDPE